MGYSIDKGNVVMVSKGRKEPICMEELVTKTKKGEEQRKLRTRLLRVKNTKL